MNTLSINAQEFVPINWLNQQQNTKINTSTSSTSNTTSSSTPSNAANVKINQQTSHMNINPYHQNYSIQSYQPISYTTTESTTPIALQLPPQNYIISTSQFQFIPQPITIHPPPSSQINFTTSAQLISPSPPSSTSTSTSTQYNYINRHPFLIPSPMQYQQNWNIEYNPHGHVPNYIQNHKNNKNRINNNNNNNNNNNKYNNNNNQNINRNKNKKNYKNNYEANQQFQQMPTNVNNLNNHPKPVNKIYLDKDMKINNKKNSNNSSMQIELNNENEFPSLNKEEKSNKKQQQQNNDIFNTSASSATTTITVLSENQKLLIKNVNFLKTQVEQFYRDDQEDKKLKLSFKDALSKPHNLIIDNENSKKIHKNDTNNNDNLKILTSSRASSNDALKNKNEKENDDYNDDDNNKNNKSLTKKKKKSRKKTKAKVKSDNENENENKEYYEEFNLDNNDFPDLNNESLYSTDTSSKKKYSKPKSTINSDNESSSINKQNKSIEKSNKPQQSNTKKSNLPIVLEFANVISALEKGQQEEKRYLVKPFSNSIDKKQKNVVNPLDSNPSMKRGKEREKPKNKKPSTLKKIILKEREEKKRNRQLKTNSNQKLNLCSGDLANKSDLEKNENDNNEKTTSYNSSCNENNDFDEDEDDDDDDDEDEEEDEDDDASMKRNNKTTTDATSDANDFASEDYTSNQMSPISQGSPLSIGGYTPGISPYAVASAEPISPAKLAEQVREKIHSKRFREYCNQIVNKDIDAVCTALLQEIVRFQDRLYHKNPLKAKMRRRYVMGIREVTKHLKLKKLKCVILAPNCEKIQSKGGLDEAINRIIEYSIEQDVPFVFALGRKGLGKAVNKLVPISVIGIFDFSGAEQHFKRLVELADNARSAYNEMVYEYENEERKQLMIKMSHINLPSNYTNMQPTIPCHLGHSRTPSNGSNISIDPSLINYRTHSRTPSGNFNFLNQFNNQNPLSTGHTGGHSRSASGGGGGTLNIDLSSGALLSFHKHLHTHSRTPSNCSNISFVSRLSEPISEVGIPIVANSNLTINSTTGIFNVTQVTLPNSNATIAAVQYYSEQVRNEMRECDVNKKIEDTNSNVEKNNESNEINNLNKNKNNNNNNSDDDDDDENVNQNENNNENNNDNNNNNNNQDKTDNTTLSNLHLSCIHEIDAGNEADIDEDDCDIGKTKLIIQQQQQQQQQQRRSNKINQNNSNSNIDINNIEQSISKISIKSDENEINNNNNNNNDETLNDDDNNNNHNESDSSIRKNESCGEN